MPKIFIKMGKNRKVCAISSYCLTTDTWEDFLYFLNEAEMFNNKGKKRESSRCLRAGQIFLFAHLEGGVNKIYKHQNLELKRWPLEKRMMRIERYIGLKGDDASFLTRDKYFRDIIAHPGIVKGGNKEYDETSIYETVSIENLKRLGDLVANWLDLVCEGAKIERFTNTKKIVETFGYSLGEIKQVEEV